MKKKNSIAKDLRTKKYKPRIVKAKKGKGSFKRKKIPRYYDCYRNEYEGYKR